MGVSSRGELRHVLVKGMVCSFRSPKHDKGSMRGREGYYPVRFSDKGDFRSLVLVRVKITLRCMASMTNLNRLIAFDYFIKHFIGF